MKERDMDHHCSAGFPLDLGLSLGLGTKASDMGRHCSAAVPLGEGLSLGLGSHEDGKLSLGVGFGTNVCAEIKGKHGGAEELENGRAWVHSDAEEEDCSRKRLRLSREQRALLEESFQKNRAPEPVSLCSQ